MSDFLTSLVQRQHEGGEVRSRPVPRFGPSAVPVSPRVPPTLGVTAEPRTASVPADDAGASGALSEPRPAPVLTSYRIEAARAPLADQTVAVPIRAAGSPANQTGIQGAADRSDPAPAASAIAPSKSGAPTQWVGRLDFTAPSSTQPEPDATAFCGIDASAPVAPRGPEPQRTVVRHAAIPALRLPPRVKGEARAVPAAASQPDPVPVIEVTIGRIEVRAAPTPASAPRPAPAQRHGVGLDEYLHARREDRR